MDISFRKLIENIKLTSNQEEDAIAKYKGVCKTLHDAYYPNKEYDGSTIVLIGSYGKKTNIRPPRDIDVVFKMPVAEFVRFDGLAGNKQSQLLQEIRKILIERYPLTKEISAWGKVVVVPFAEGTHTVEVLPAWELSDGSFRIPNSEGGGSWENSNPRSEMKSIVESNKQTTITNDFIRICKKWVEYCNVEIESFILEIVVVNYLKVINESPVKIEFSILTDGFLYYLKQQANTTLLRPTGTSYELGDAWLSKTESASLRVKKALRYEDTNNINEAVAEWKKIFGDDFQYVPETKKTLEENIELLRAKYPSQYEEFLDSTYGIPFELNPVYRVKIDAQITQDGYRTRSLTEYIREKLKLKRHKSIVFNITQNSVPDFDEIRWKIRNFGDEAAAIDQLRGQIYQDTGRGERRESTRYYGNHYVECYIIKNNKCVAMDRILVPIGTES